MTQLLSGEERETGTVEPGNFDMAFKIGLDDDSDPASPRSMPNYRKWFIVATICTAIVCVSIYTTTYDQLSQEFATTRLLSATGLSTFVFGIAFGPLISGPLSEHFGRRRVYLVAWLAFMIFTVPSAVAQNMNTLIATRFFGGFCGTTFLAVSGGTVGDIFSKDELQKPMALVSLASFIGPSSGPLLGGFINYYLHWRWTYYIMLIWSFLIFIAILFVPETFHPIVCEAKARELRTETGDTRYWAQSETTRQSTPKTIALTLLRPFQLFFLEPMCFCLNIYSAILLGILYLFFGAIPQIFRTNYDMNLWQSGLTFLGIIIGMALAALTSPFWVLMRTRLVVRHREETGKEDASEPEYQLPSAMVGGVLIPAGLFWFAWTIQGPIHWCVPILGSSFFGFGSVLSSCNLLFFNYLLDGTVEAYTQYAASALAANGFARAFLAGMLFFSIVWFASVFMSDEERIATFPLIQIPMFDQLGYSWGTSVLAFLTVAIMPSPWLFFKYGKFLRRKSKFASTP
ncbi:unnamed protein product [Clonostachys rosea]|uniref:Major facilitator superfamily (MFS) profile domain-containing protein n=1 Tax=Bionectria ochroleuca TaxID=29856 RepID=A0ABY6TW20_BIOOC|nr:unnamed protein product [Clonostachys rosea]